MKVNSNILLFLLLSIGLITCKPTKVSSFKEPYLGMEFVKIPHGSFSREYTEAPKGNSIKKSQRVFITKDFWLGKTEVTQEQWSQIMGEQELHPDKPSPFRGLNSNYPVVSISYYDIEMFLNKMNSISKDYYFRLPTEAEWEYACRAGTKTPFYFGRKIYDSLSNFNAEISSDLTIPGKFIGRPMPVGSYPANSWGLMDMHGNVWEWVSDWYAPISTELEQDPRGPETGKEKVLKGGSWYFGAMNAQSSYRKAHAPDLWGFSIGFRIVCEKRK